MSADLVDYLAEIIQDGIDAGVFEPVDPDRTAEYLSATLEGINLQQTTRTDAPGALLREELESYIETELLVDDAAF